MTIIRVAACALFLGLLAGCASSGYQGKSAYGGGGGSLEFATTTQPASEATSALPDYQEILVHPGRF